MTHDIQARRRHPRRPSLVAASVAALVMSSAAWAQPATTCDSTLTIGRCIDRLGGLTNTAQAVSQQTAAATAAKSTGLQLGGGSSSIHDYLPKLAAALLAPGVSDKPGALGVRLNFPPGGSAPFTGQFELVVNKPELFEPLIGTVAEANRPVVRERLGNKLNDLDDVTFAFSANVESHAFGRRYRQYAPEISAVAAEVLAPLQGRAIIATSSLGAVYVGIRNRALPARAGDAACAVLSDTLANPEPVPLTCLEPGFRNTLVERIRVYARATGDLARQAPTVLEASGFNLLGDLVNNQPQLNGKIDFRRRRDIVGPDQLSGEFSFEHGFTNLNSLRGYCRTRATGPSAAITAACLGEYAALPSTRAALARQHRLAFTGKFSLQPAYTASIAGESGAPLALGRAWEISPRLVYGSYLGGADAPDRLRLDLDASYNANKKDSGRESRLVSTLTLTGKVSDQSNAVVSFVYANKPEFLGDVQRKFGANVGFSYKLVDRNPQ